MLIKRCRNSDRLGSACEHSSKKQHTFQHYRQLSTRRPYAPQTLEALKATKETANTLKPQIVSKPSKNPFVWRTFRRSPDRPTRESGPLGNWGIVEENQMQGTADLLGGIGGVGEGLGIRAFRLQDQ